MEDTPTVAASLALAIEGMDNTEAVIARTATEALRYIKPGSRPLSAVVTDFNLPDFDGLTLIQKIREAAPDAFVPMILISAQETPAHEESNTLRSPNAVFQKPFSMKEVCRVLENLL